MIRIFKQLVNVLCLAILLFVADVQVVSADAVGSYSLVGETTLKASSSNGSITVTSVVGLSEISVFSNSCNSTELPVISTLASVVTITGIENCNLSLSVPVSLLVELSSYNGSVQSTGAFPSVVVRAKNGGVTVSASNATLLDAKTTNGDVRLTDVGVLGSKLVASSDNGFVRLTRANGPFSVRAVNKDIVGNTLVFPGDSVSTFNNKNGDIKISKVSVTKRQDGKSYKLTATSSTKNGRVVISRGATSRGNRRYANGQTVFSGVEPKASTSLRTINGDISFLR